MSDIRAIFFDLDNTLINVKTMFSFQEYFFTHGSLSKDANDSSYSAFVARLASLPNKDRSVLNREFYQSFRGRSRHEVCALAPRWFEELVRRTPSGLWVDNTLALARDMKLNGFLLVAVTGACEDFVAPVLAHIGFDACIGARLEVIDDLYTGLLLPPQTIGPGKAQAIRDFSVMRGIDLRTCIACGDHITDQPMLEATGEAFVVAGDSELEALARERSWPIIYPRYNVFEQITFHV